MTRPRPLLAVLVAAGSVGCASYAGVARQYTDAGRHELAALYYAQAYLGDVADPAGKEALRAAIELSVQNLDADYDARVQAGEFHSALGLAIRREELLGFGARLGFEEFDPASAARMVAEVSSSAAREALKKVDDAEAKGVEPKVQLRLLREALALAPDDPELSSRYTNLVRRLRRHIAVRCARDVTSARDVAADCDAFAARVISSITAVQREIIRIVPATSDKKDAEMIVKLSISMSDSQWKKTKQGKATGKVERKNKYKDTEKDSKGKPLYDKVKAQFAIYERTTSASTSASIRIDDLRPDRPDLFAKQDQGRKSDRATYYEWTGDHRALGVAITAHGTDQTPPKDPRLLAKQAWESSADALAKQIVAVFEN